MIRHDETAMVTTIPWVLDEAGRPGEGDPTVSAYQCRSEPLSAEEQTALGGGTADAERIKAFARAWPYDVQRILLDGRLWRQIGPAKRFRAGSLTRHVEIILEAL